MECMHQVAQVTEGMVWVSLSLPDLVSEPLLCSLLSCPLVPAQELAEAEEELRRLVALIPWPLIARHALYLSTSPMSPLRCPYCVACAYAQMHTHTLMHSA